jgi:hypothetical protein
MQLVPRYTAATVSFTTCACVSVMFALLSNCGHIDDGEQDTHGTLLSVCLFVLIVTSSVGAVQLTHSLKAPWFQLLNL